jgi:hypothetical protein
MTRIPWDWSVITSDLPHGERTGAFIPAKKELTPAEREAEDLRQQIEQRRGAFGPQAEAGTQDVEEEMSEWNDYYG